LVLSKEKPIPYQPPLPPNEAPSGIDAAAGVTPVGLRPPFVTPAAAHSHPDCRGIPILIVAPQDESPHRETDDILLLLEENSRLRKLMIQLSNLLGDLPPFASVTPIGGQIRQATDHPIQKRVRNG
jgi:hypothetical protein